MVKTEVSIITVILSIFYRPALMSSMLSSQDHFCPFWDQFCGFAYIIRLGDHFCGRTSQLWCAIRNFTFRNLGSKSRLIEIPRPQELGVNKRTEKPIEKQFNTSLNDNRLAD